MKIGYIYKFSSPNGKIYIGKTFNINKRKSDYKCLHCKGQKILYHSLLKYGFENHEFEILKEGLFTNEELSKLECYYIIHFNSFVKWNKLGMNLTLGGEGCNLIHHSQKTKDKISKTKKGSPKTVAQINATKNRVGRKIPKSQDWIRNNAEGIKKPILQFSLDGEFIKEWKSAMDVELELGLGRKNISCNLRNKTLSAFGFIWRFKNEKI
jgi:group I intron endonuclease